MIHLSSIPAFGWETKACNANRAYLQAATGKIRAEADAKARKLLPPPTASNWTRLGSIYEAHRSRIERELTQKALMRSHWWRNGKKIAGYAPILGTLTGLYFFKKTWATPAEQLPNKMAHLFRHAIEATSCGLILVIPDYYATRQQKMHTQTGWAGWTG